MSNPPSQNEERQPLRHKLPPQSPPPVNPQRERNHKYDSDHARRFYARNSPHVPSTRSRQQPQPPPQQETDTTANPAGSDSLDLTALTAALEPMTKIANVNEANMHAHAAYLDSLNASIPSRRPTPRRGSQTEPNYDLPNVHTVYFPNQLSEDEFKSRRELPATLDTLLFLWSNPQPGEDITRVRTILSTVAPLLNFLAVYLSRGDDYEGVRLGGELMKKVAVFHELPEGKRTYQSAKAENKKIKAEKRKAAEREAGGGPESLSSGPGNGKEKVSSKKQNATVPEPVRGTQHRALQTYILPRSSAPGSNDPSSSTLEVAQNPTQLAKPEHQNEMTEAEPKGTAKALQTVEPTPEDCKPEASATRSPAGPWSEREKIKALELQVTMLTDKADQQAAKIAANDQEIAIAERKAAKEVALDQEVQKLAMENDEDPGEAKPESKEVQARTLTASTTFRPSPPGSNYPSTSLPAATPTFPHYPLDLRDEASTVADTLPDVLLSLLRRWTQNLDPDDPAARPVRKVIGSVAMLLDFLARSMRLAAEHDGRVAAATLRSAVEEHFDDGAGDSDEEAETNHEGELEGGAAEKRERADGKGKARAINPPETRSPESNVPSSQANQPEDQGD